MSEMINETFHVIDAHCHIYPEKIVDRAVAGTDQFYGTRAACRGTVGELVEIGKKTGIDHFVVQSVATSPKQVTSINEFIAAEVAEHPGVLTGLGTVHPDSADQTEDIRRIKALGLKGIKIHPDIQQFKIDDYRFLKVYELCEEEGLPILMHTGDYRYDYSNPNRLLPILKIFTGLTVIGAHFGGWSVWEEATRELAGMPNLYVDCSSTFQFMKDITPIPDMIAAYGADRVLFGSDFPMWSPQKELELFMQLPLSDADRKLIFSENAKKVFSIK